VIPAIIEIRTGDGADIPGVTIDFATLPRVGEGVEMDVAMLGNPEALKGHPAVMWFDNRAWVSLRVISIYWQPQVDGSSKPFMIPVINMDLLTSSKITG
jgi:hypothetical protein